MFNDHSKSAKPERPIDSPLFWHATGRWAKKIRGRLNYFGRGTHDDALAQYEAVKDHLHSGRTPRDEANGLTVYQLCDKFLTAKQAQRNTGELAPRSFTEYGETCKRLTKTFGKSRLVTDLRPDDFAKLRGTMTKRWGPARVKCEVVRSRTPFNWAFKMRLLDRPVVFGEGFKVPTAKTLRSHKAKQGPKMYEADEIRHMLEAAGPGLKAMILLGVNCAFGNHD